MKKLLLVVTVLLAFGACSTYKITKQRYVSILTYNVENLFDTEHDLGKLDYSFLPLSMKKTTLKQSVDKYCATVKNPAWLKECKELDWTEAKLSQKLLRLSRVIEESTSGCPDVLVLQEVENLKVLKRLNSMLSCGYTAMLLSDDRDARGIDVAILSKYEVRSSTNHSIPFKGIDAEQRKDTRSLIDVEFSVDGFAMRVIGLHLPSPHRPASFRSDAVKFIESLYFKDPIAIIVAGDWNVPASEEAKEKTFAGLRKSFHLSDDIVRASSTDQGSSYYKKDKTWSFLDKIALSRNSFDSIACKVVGYLPGQRERGTGAPLSFPLFAKSGEGVSDHLPVLCRASF